MSVTLLAFTPARKAALALLPSAYICRPRTVNPRTSPTTTAMSSQTSRPVGIPRTVPVKLPCTTGGTTELQAEQVKPLVSPSTKPCITPFMPSVMTTGGISNSTMPSPFVMPTPTPSKSTSGTTHHALLFSPSAVVVSSTAIALSTQGTERSMPPIRMMKVCPAATMPTNEASNSNCPILPG